MKNIIEKLNGNFEVNFIGEMEMEIMNDNVVCGIEKFGSGFQVTIFDRHNDEVINGQYFEMMEIESILVDSMDEVIEKLFNIFK